MNLNFTTLIIFALGIFLGLLIGNKNFRKKVFAGFRNFSVEMKTRQSYRTQNRQSNIGNLHILKVSDKKNYTKKEVITLIEQTLKEIKENN